MVDLKVFINGVQADIGNQGDFPIVINRQVMDFQNATSQGGDHTYDVRFPATKTNDRIFGGHLADVGAANKFRSVQAMEVEILADGTRIFKGRPVVKSASRTDGYLVVLYSDNIDWAAQLQSKSLRDLRTLPDVPFTGSRFYGAPHEPASPLRQEDIWLLDSSQTTVWFPLIAYGNYPIFAGLSTGLGANKVQDLHWVDINPACYVVPVVKAILREIGFSLAGGFFDTLDAARLHTAYTGDTPPRWNWGLLARANASNTPYSYNAILAPPSTNFDYQVGQGLIWRLVTSTENWDYSDSYFQSSPAEQYIVPVSGTYRFILDLGNVTLTKGLEGTLVNPAPYDYERTALAIVVIPDDPDAFDALQTSLTEYIGLASVSIVSDSNIIAFYDFGTGYQESPYTLLPFTTGGTYSQSQTGTPGNPGASLDGTGTVSLQIDGVELSQGTRVEFWLLSQFAITDPVTNQTIAADAYELDVKETSFPDLLQVAPLLPDMTQYDYIEALVTMFNLRFSVDADRRIIRFETFDRFYRNNQFARDWTPYGSDAGTPSKPVPFSERSVLKYANDDQDGLLSKLGTTQFESRQSNGSVFALRGLETIEVKAFSPTYEREYFFLNLFGNAVSNKLVIPCIASESQLGTPQGEIVWDYAYKPRILTSAGMQPGRWTYHGNTLTEYPASRFSWNEAGGIGLAFGDSAGRIVRGGGAVATPVQNEGLYRSHWRRFFAMRPNAHVQEVTISLDAREFSQSDPSLPILFHGIHYWVYAYVEAFDPIAQGPIKIELLRQV